MKGLIFNLLDSMARKSGCADEAWDLVMEFVASETDHDALSDTCLSCFDASKSPLSFEAPAEAMIQCLSTDSNGPYESLSEFPEMSVIADPDEALRDSIPALMGPECCTRLRAGSPEGFSHDLLGLLEQLLAEALSGDDEADEADADLDEPLFLALPPARRSGS